MWYRYLSRVDYWSHRSLRGHLDLFFSDGLFCFAQLQHIRRDGHIINIRICLHQTPTYLKKIKTMHQYIFFWWVLQTTQKVYGPTWIFVHTAHLFRICFCTHHLPENRNTAPADLCVLPMYLVHFVWVPQSVVDNSWCHQKHSGPSGRDDHQTDVHTWTWRHDHRSQSVNNNFINLHQRQSLLKDLYF